MPTWRRAAARTRPPGPGTTATVAPKVAAERPGRDLHGVAAAGRCQPRDDDGPIGALRRSGRRARTRGRRRHGCAVAPRRAPRSAMKTRPPSCHDASPRAVRGDDELGLRGHARPGQPSDAGPDAWFVTVRSADARPQVVHEQPCAVGAVDPPRLVAGAGTGRQLGATCAEASCSPRRTAGRTGAARSRRAGATRVRRGRARTQPDGDVVERCPSSESMTTLAPCSRRRGGPWRISARLRPSSWRAKPTRDAPAAVGGDGRVERLATALVAARRARSSDPASAAAGAVASQRDRSGRRWRRSEQASRCHWNGSATTPGCVIWRTRPRATRG